MDNTIDSAAHNAAQGDWVARARALVPMIEALSPTCDTRCELPSEVVDALHEAGLFRLLIPRDRGGAEVDLLTFSEVIETIAQGDGSTAWCLGQNAVSNMTSAYMPDDEARIMFRGRRTVLAWGAGLNGEAAEVEGGYRVTGRWAFASGSRHATWLGGQSPIVAADGSRQLEPNGSPTYRMFVFPKDICRIDSKWDVMGLRGTGSDSYEIADVFVPRSHAFLRTSPAPHPGALYRTPLAAIYPIAFGSVALGLAKAMLDAFVEMAGKKTPQGLRPLRESDAIQSILGHTATRLGSARANLRQTIADISGCTLDDDRDIKLRADTTFATSEAVAVADILYHESGATAVFAGQPFEHRFRDIHAVAQQTQARRANFELVGKRMLGIDTGPVFF
jgi:alkylation response protein AidB-like acyl-CoA dehydrogenase